MHVTELADRDLTTAPYDLADRYRSGSGSVLLTGVQAIARQFVEQQVRDIRAGKRVATFVSGYQGSPLGGVDKMLLGMPKVLVEHDITFVPGMNEELAATSVWGSQADLSAAPLPTQADPRRRRRRLVRQGPRRRPRHRRAAARQHVRGQPERRHGALRRRRPGVQVLHRPRGERAVAGRARHTGPVPPQRQRDRHDGHARGRAVAGVGLHRRAEDRRRRRRRRLDRRRQRRGPTDHRPADRVGGPALRLQAAPRWPHRRTASSPRQTSTARVGQSSTPTTPPTTSTSSNSTPPTRRSASSPPARLSIRSARPSWTSVPTTPPCTAPASGSCASACRTRSAASACSSSPTASTRSWSSRTRPRSSRPRSARSSTARRTRRASSARRTPRAAGSCRWTAS